MLCCGVLRQRDLGEVLVADGILLPLLSGELAVGELVEQGLPRSDALVEFLHPAQALLLAQPVQQVVLHLDHLLGGLGGLYHLRGGLFGGAHLLLGQLAELLLLVVRLDASVQLALSKFGALVRKTGLSLQRIILLEKGSSRACCAFPCRGRECLRILDVLLYLSVELIALCYLIVDGLLVLRKALAELAQELQPVRLGLRQLALEHLELEVVLQYLGLQPQRLLPDLGVLVNLALQRLVGLIRPRLHRHQASDHQADSHRDGADARGDGRRAHGTQADGSAGARRTYQADGRGERTRCLGTLDDARHALLDGERRLHLEQRLLHRLALIAEQGGSTLCHTERTGDALQGLAKGLDLALGVDGADACVDRLHLVVEVVGTLGSLPELIGDEAELLGSLLRLFPCLP